MIPRDLTHLLTDMNLRYLSMTYALGAHPRRFVATLRKDMAREKRALGKQLSLREFYSTFTENCLAGKDKRGEIAHEINRFPKSILSTQVQNIYAKNMRYHAPFALEQIQCCTACVTSKSNKTFGHYAGENPFFMPAWSHYSTV